MKTFKIAPSVLSADFGKLDEEIKMLNTSEAELIHVDVMDGRFVPNISFGQMLVKQMARVAEKPLDVHLMIVEPEKYVESFADAGAATVSFHLEATDHVHRVVQQIRNKGIRAGVAINPHTSITLLEDILEELDQVIIMSVNPGFGGQKFIYQTMNKLKRLKSMIIERNLDTEIEIDGGVGLQNAATLIEHGADILVAGSAVFKTDDPLETIRQFKSIEVGHFDL